MPLQNLQQLGPTYELVFGSCDFPPCSHSTGDVKLIVNGIIGCQSPSFDSISLFGRLWALEQEDIDTYTHIFRERLECRHTDRMYMEYLQVT